jgi:MoxR-like ATPase
LPEAQLDRFLLKVVLGQPTLEETVGVLQATLGGAPSIESKVRPVLSRTDVARMRQLVRSVPTSSDVVQLAARIVLATHPGSDAPDDVRRSVRHGASPRGGQALLWAAKARALTRGRLHVALEDIEALCVPALRHRLILSYEGEASGTGTDVLVRSAFAYARERTPGPWK